MKQILTGEQRPKKSLSFADPKQGKSSFHYHATQPLLSLNYDGGDPGLPPGVGDQVWVQNYPPDLIEVSSSTSQWKRSGKVGAMIIQDIVDVRDQVMNGADELILTDWMNCGGDKSIKAHMPRPASVLADGLVVLNQQVLNWLMADPSWNIKDPRGAGKNVQAFYGDRLDRMNLILRWLLALPINVSLCTWATQEYKKGPNDAESKPTGKKIPDIGGKLDQWGPGAVDACLFHYSELRNGLARYFVSTKSTNSTEIVGVRGARYGLPEIVDVTIGIPENKLPPAMTVGNPAYVNPWNRVWGSAQLVDAGKTLVAKSTTKPS